jgi:hypothetical protein
MKETMPDTALINADTDTEHFLAEKAERIRTRVRRVAQDIVEIGKDLSEARERCQHGEWLPWLKREFGWSEAAAYNYIAVYERLGPKLPTGGTLEPLRIDASALYLLAQQSTPEAVRDQAIERAQTGEHMTRETVREMVSGEVKAQVSYFRARAEKAETARATLAAVIEAEKKEAAKINAAQCETICDIICTLSESLVISPKEVIDGEAKIAKTVGQQVKQRLPVNEARTAAAWLQTFVREAAKL